MKTVKRIIKAWVCLVEVVTETIAWIVLIALGIAAFIWTLWFGIVLFQTNGIYPVLGAPVTLFIQVVVVTCYYIYVRPGVKIRTIRGPETN